MTVVAPALTVPQLIDREVIDGLLQWVHPLEPDAKYSILLRASVQSAITVAFPTLAGLVAWWLHRR